MRKTFILFMVLLLWVLLIFSLLYFLCYWFQSSISLTLDIVQIAAIIIWWVWAYHKFWWAKSSESAIQMRWALMEYRTAFETQAAIYRSSVAQGDKENEYWINYVLALIPHYNAFLKDIKTSLYLPKELRNEILETIFLTVNRNNIPENSNDIDVSWREFWRMYSILDDKLEKIVTGSSII